jgi:hypothetical protein
MFLSRPVGHRRRLWVKTGSPAQLSVVCFHQLRTCRRIRSSPLWAAASRAGKKLEAPIASMRLPSTVCGIRHDDSAVSERKVAAIMGRKLAAAFRTPSTMQAGFCTGP